MNSIKLSVGVKINLIAVIGSLGFFLYLWLNLSQGEDTHSRLTNLEQQQLPILVSINLASLNMLQLKDFLSVAISSSEEAMIENAHQHSKVIVDELKKIASFNNQFSEQSNALLINHEKYWVSAKSLALGMINETVDYDQLAELSQNMNTNFLTINSGLASLRKDVINEFTTTVATINSNNTSGLYVGSILGTSLVVLLVLITYFIALNITKSISKVTSNLDDLASRGADLTKRLRVESNDEVGQLVMAFNSFIGSMEKLISQTVSVSKKVTSQAENLHSIATQTHQGIVEQQQEIHMVASAVTELSASSTEVAKNADGASILTQKANDETTKSNVIIQQNRETITSLAHEVTRAAEVINQLHSKTNTIGSMVDVIRGIADQTNLLALNAAIEAARAGEQGRGFAVVADEVRTLANSTQDSTIEIENLIRALQNDAIEAVDVMKKGSLQASDSVQQSSLVEEALGSISHFVSDINDRSIHVSTASKEQSQVSDELSNSIVRINQVADKTVNKADQTIQTSEQLHSLANELNQLISQFTVS